MSDLNAMLHLKWKAEAISPRDVFHCQHIQSDLTRESLVLRENLVLCESLVL